MNAIISLGRALGAEDASKGAVADATLWYSEADFNNEEEFTLFCRSYREGYDEELELERQYGYEFNT